MKKIQKMANCRRRDEILACLPCNPVIIPRITKHTYVNHQGNVPKSKISTVFSVNKRCVIKVVEIFLGIDVGGNVTGHLMDQCGRELAKTPVTNMPTWKSNVTYEGNNVAAPTFSPIVVLEPGWDYMIDLDFAFNVCGNEPIKYQTLAVIPEMPHTVTTDGLTVTFKNYSPMIHTIRFISV